MIVNNYIWDGWCETKMPTWLEYPIRWAWNRGCSKSISCAVQIGSTRGYVRNSLLCKRRNEKATYWKNSSQPCKRSSYRIKCCVSVFVTKKGHKCIVRSTNRNEENPKWYSNLRLPTSLAFWWSSKSDKGSRRPLYDSQANWPRALIVNDEMDADPTVEMNWIKVLSVILKAKVGCGFPPNCCRITITAKFLVSRTIRWGSNRHQVELEIIDSRTDIPAIAANPKRQHPISRRQEFIVLKMLDLLRPGISPFKGGTSAAWVLVYCLAWVS